MQIYKAGCRKGACAVLCVFGLALVLTLILLACLRFPGWSGSLCPFLFFCG